MANMMEWLIRKHCEKESLGWPPCGIDAAQPVAARAPAKKAAAKNAQPAPRRAAADRQQN